MYRNLFNATIVALMLLNCAPSAAAKTAVAGWVEPVRVLPERINFNAKLDTGAKHSSLNSRNIELIDVKGEQQVRFEVRSREGQQHSLQLPLMRHTTIKRHFGKSQQRPVGEMTICLGKKVKKVEVNLVDRSGFNYQMLLGRSYLAPDTLVDSAQTNITTPDC